MICGTQRDMIMSWYSNALCVRLLRNFQAYSVSNYFLDTLMVYGCIPMLVSCNSALGTIAKLCAMAIVPIRQVVTDSDMNHSLPLRQHPSPHQSLAMFVAASLVVLLSRDILYLTNTKIFGHTSPTSHGLPTLRSRTPTRANKGRPGDLNFENLLATATDVFNYNPNIGTEVQGVDLAGLTDWSLYIRLCAPGTRRTSASMSKGSSASILESFTSHARSM